MKKSDEIRRFLQDRGDGAPSDTATAVGRAIDTASNTWFALSGYLEERIKASQEVVNSPLLPPEPTEHERGRIAAFKEILGLPARSR